MGGRVVPEQPKRWEPSETIAAGLAALVLAGGSAAWRGSIEPWHYGVAIAGAVLLLAGAGETMWARLRRGR